MRAVVTGANGFVGRALVDRLLAQGRLRAQPLQALVATDLAIAHRLGSGPGVPIAGDVRDPGLLDALFTHPIDVVFHLASTRAGSAAPRGPVARRANLEGTPGLLERARRQVQAGNKAPTFVFASSVAVFGRPTAQVDEATLPQPVRSYGTRKLIGELLVADASRRGWVDGRSLRLPAVVARRRVRTGQLSGFLSHVVHELAAGRSCTCPTSPRATTWAASLSRTVDNLLHATEVPEDRLPPRRVVTLPTLHTSMAEVVAAVGRAHGTPATALVRYEPQEDIEALFGRFPPLSTPEARALGFRDDGTMDALVQRALACPGPGRRSPSEIRMDPSHPHPPEGVPHRFAPLSPRFPDAEGGGPPAPSAASVERPSTMPPQAVRSVAVIGAGIAGLSCALAAASRGARVQVFDAASEAHTGVAHIEVAPNMLRGLVALGVGDACIRAGFAYHGINVVNRHGRTLFTLPTPNLAGPRYPTAMGIRRSDLRTILEQAVAAQGVTFRRGAEVQSVQAHGHGAAVLARGHHGCPADLVVLADGGRSALREVLFPNAHHVSNVEQACWHTLISRPVDLDRPRVVLLANARRLVMVPVRADLAGLSFIEPLGEAAAVSPDDHASHLRERLLGLGMLARDATRRLDPHLSVALHPVRSGVLDTGRSRLPVLAVGHCAHAMPLHFGQADAQTIEDAQVLADVLTAAGDGRALIDLFHGRRTARVRQVHDLATAAAQWDGEPQHATDVPTLHERLLQALALPA